MFKPRRELGRTGFVATRIGIGDLADRSLGLDECVATLRRALDAGLNVVDTAPAYEGGFSEQIVGTALRGRRQGVFVIDKIDELGAEVTPQVLASLERLGLEAVDLFVFHNVSDIDTWNELAASGGAMQELTECVAQGRARLKGISSHHPEVLRAAVSSGTCDVVMFPVGPFVDARYVKDVLPLCRERGVGSVCFKTFGAGKLLGDTDGYGRPLGSGGGALGLPRLSVEECVRYTLTVDPDVALLGMSSPNEQDAALAAAAVFEPMSGDELARTRERARRAIEGKGEIWWDPK